MPVSGNKTFHRRMAESICRRVAMRYLPPRQAAAVQEWRLRCRIGAANVGGTKLGLMLQKPRLPAITWGAHSSTVRNSQSHTTSPAPRFCTAHHGALPKLPAWLADTPRPTAAANPAAANVDLKMIVMAPSLSHRDVGARRGRRLRPYPNGSRAEPAHQM